MTFNEATDFTEATLLVFQSPQFLVIGGDLVTISLVDGSITFGPHYKLDEAAQAFWKGIIREYADFLKWKNGQTPA
jgi:hypothetical protein